MASLSAPRRGDFSIACRLLGLVTVLCLTTRVEALDKFWTKAGGGNFNDGANWNTIFPPDANDIAHFGLSSPPSLFQFVYTVDFTDEVFSNSLLIENDFVTFNLDGHFYINTQSPFTVATEIGNQPGRSGSLTVKNGTLDAGAMFLGVGGGLGTLNIFSGGHLQTDTFATIGHTGNSTVNVDGAFSDWLGTGLLTVGFLAAGTLNVTAGGEVRSSTGIIGRESGNGIATISGDLSLWNNSGDLTIGNNGNGTLNIHSGGRVENVNAHVGFVAGHTGTVNVDGLNTEWVNSGSLFVGELGSGTMNIIGLGQVVSRGAAIGAAAGASGSVTVSGGDADWFNFGDMNVGGGGTGTLDINTFGSVTSNGDGFIGRDSGSMGNVHVDGDGSWSNFNLTVGAAGVGTLTLTNGGRVFSDDSVLGRDAGSTGTATITGDDSQWDPEFLRVGDSGHGTVNVTAGGHLDTVNAVIGVEMGSIGEVTVDGEGSMWTNSDLIFVSSFAPGTGTLTVANGGVVSAQGGLIVRVLGTLRGDGQIIGNVGNVGVVAPGLSPGALHVTGDYTQVANGVLEIELAGTTGGTDYDQLLVTGAVALDGALNVSLTGGFVPTSGMSFDILDWGSLSGAFNTIMLPALSAGLVWNTSQLHTTGMLSVALTGDFNFDGPVDAADYVVWRKNGGTQAEFDTWRTNFGQTVGGGSGSPGASSSGSTVPEPASLVLLASAVLAVFVRRRNT